MTWTKDQDNYLEKHFPNQLTQEIADHLSRTYSSVAHRAYLLGLRKSKAFKSNPQLNGHINLLRHGRETRFKKGHDSFNKGKSWGDYLSKEAQKAALKTAFKKGNSPHNTLHDGAISIRNSKGRPYKWIRISKANWKMLHRVNWENAKGKIPRGMCVWFKDGDSLNCSVDNLELITRTENMRRNTIQRYPDEVKQAIKSISKLKKAIKNAKK